MKSSNEIKNIKDLTDKIKELLNNKDKQYKEEEIKEIINIDMFQKHNLTIIAFNIFLKFLKSITFSTDLNEMVYIELFSTFKPLVDSVKFVNVILDEEVENYLINECNTIIKVKNNKLVFNKSLEAVYSTSVILLKKVKVVELMNKINFFSLNSILLDNLAKKVNFNSLLFEYICDGILLIFKSQSLGNDSLETIYNNKSMNKSLKTVKSLILSENKRIENFIKAIDFLYGLIYIENSLKKQDSDRIFSRDYFYQLKDLYLGKTSNPTIIRKLDEGLRIMNDNSDDDNNNNLDMVTRVKSCTDETENLLKEFIGINKEEEGDEALNNDVKRSYRSVIGNKPVNRKRMLSLSTNPQLKLCYDKLLVIFNTNYDDITKKFENNDQECNKFAETIKLIKYVLADIDNVDNLIKDKVLEKILIVANNNKKIFNKYCVEQAYSILGAMINLENAINIVLSQDYAVKFLINKFNFIYDALMKCKNFEKIEEDFEFIKCKMLITSIIESTKNNSFIKANTDSINPKRIMNILEIIKDQDPLIINMFLQILINLINYYKASKIKLLPDNNAKLLEIITSFLCDFENKKNWNSYSSLILIIELKGDDSEFIQKLMDKGILFKIIDLLLSFKPEESFNYSELLLHCFSLLIKLIDNDKFIDYYIDKGFVQILKIVQQYVYNVKISELFVNLYRKLLEKRGNNLSDKIKEDDLVAISNSIFIKYMGSPQNNIINDSIFILLIIMQNDTKSKNLCYYIVKYSAIGNIFKLSKLYQNEQDIVYNILNLLSQILNKIKEINGCENAPNININNSIRNSISNGLPENDLKNIYANKIHLEMIFSFSDIIFNNYKNLNLLNFIEEIMINLFQIANDFNKQQEIFNSFLKMIGEFSGKTKEMTFEFSSKILCSLLDDVTKFIIQNKKLIGSSLSEISHLIYLILTKGKINIKVAKLLMELLNKICTEQNNDDLLNIVDECILIFNSYRNQNNLQSKETILFVINILTLLSEFRNDILDNNFVFLLSYLVMSKSNDNLLSSKPFKIQMIKISSVYYIETDEIAKLILKYLKDLFNIYSNIPVNDQSIENMTFILKIISGLCFKTPYIKNEIKKKNEIIECIKKYCGVLDKAGKKSKPLKNEIENCQKIINTEKEYLSKKQDEKLKVQKRQQALLLKQIGNDKIEEIRDILCKPLKINFFSNDKWFKKVFCEMDDSLLILTAYERKNETKESLQKMKFYEMDKCVSGEGREEFKKKGLFGHKADPLKTFCIIKDTSIGKEWDNKITFNFEVIDLDRGKIFVDSLNFLLDFKRNHK